MRRLTGFIGIGIFAALIVSLISSPYANAADVPITYPGDTDETIARRARWMEGAKTEGQMIWWGILRPNLAKVVIAEFNKIYPFIKVNFWRGRGEEIATKLEAEYAIGRTNLDITLGGEPYNYPRWRKMGMLAKFADIVPQIQKYDKRMYSKFGDWVVPGNNGVSPQYNTNLVSAAEAPQSWEDLLDPKWKGKIGMTRDVKVWTTMALADGGWGIEKTEQYLRKLKKQNPVWAQGHTAGHVLLIAGEFNLFAEEYIYHVFNSRKKGAPVDWARVSPIVVSGPSYTFQKKTRHPNAAKLFLEWALSPQGLITYEKITGYGAAAPGSGTRLSKALEGLNLCFRTEEVQLKVLELGLIKRFTDALGAGN